MAPGCPELDLGAWAARVSDDGLLKVPVALKPRLDKPCFMRKPKIAADGWPEYMGMKFGEASTASRWKLEMQCI